MMAGSRDEHKDLKQLLSSLDRDYLINNRNDEIEISKLDGKTVGIYFSASWCGPCQRFTPTLINTYNQLISSSNNGNFQIVFVSADQDDDSFNAYFSNMPWLAIPFSDSETRSRLNQVFEIKGIPHLVIIDENGKQVLSRTGVDIIREYDSDAYPFTQHKINSLKLRDEATRRNQSLTSVLASSLRDFVVSSHGNKVPIAQLEGKIVGLYFSFSTFKPCMDFTPKLMEVYEKLKANGENFEIVMVPLDGEEEEEEESFNEGFKNIPWFALPSKDKSCQKLVRYFDLSTLPSLVIIGEDGKTLHSNAVEAIQEHGDLAYPFTQKRFNELLDLKKAKEEAQTLESILVYGDRDFVIGKNRAKIPVSSLVGKNILLYFSAHWCSPCRAFLPKLIEAYHKMKEKYDEGLEVIFISSDRNEASFDEFFSEMPWLALPFNDERKAVSLKHMFKVESFPMLVAIGQSGRTVTKAAKDLIMSYGADAYPFTADRLTELIMEKAKDWPLKVEHVLHEEHELVLTSRQIYTCNGCFGLGHVLSFCCVGCDFDLHPNCAL